MVNVFTLCFLPLLPVLVFCILRHKSSSSEKLRLPPGPRPWPSIGNIIHLRKELHVSAARFAQVYGPIISLKLGSQLFIIGSSPKAAAEILKTHDRALSGRAYRLASPYKGTSLEGFSIIGANECSETWKFLRTLCRSELFSSKAIELQTSLVLSKDLISLGEHGDAYDLQAKITRLLEDFATPNIGEFFPILAALDIQSLRKKTHENNKKLGDVWKVFIQERRHRNSYDDPKLQDFLDVFLDNNFNDDQIQALFTELFIAGTDTTTTAVEWALAELIKNKGAMEKLAEEVRNGIHEQRTIEESQISELPYLQACVKETLRLHPPGPLLLPHRAVETCEVMNFKIPQNSTVIVNFWAIGRDPTLWEDPLSFKPERFLGSSLDLKGNNYEYLPFGSGRRMCPGLPLASKLVSLLLASLVAFFDWSLPNGDDPAQLDMTERLRISTLLKEQPLSLVPRHKS